MKLVSNLNAAKSSKWRDEFFDDRSVALENGDGVSDDLDGGQAQVRRLRPNDVLAFLVEAAQVEVDCRKSLKGWRPRVHLLRLAPSSVENDEDERSASVGCSGKKLGRVERRLGGKKDEDVWPSKELPEFSLFVTKRGTVVK